MDTARAEVIDPEERIAELRREHSELDDQLAILESNVHLTVAEQQEVRRIKRLKLSKKDQIHFLAAQLCRNP